MHAKFSISFIVASVAMLIANASRQQGVVQEHEIPARETFTFVSDEGYRKIVISPDPAKGSSFRWQSRTGQEVDADL